MEGWIINPSMDQFWLVSSSTQDWVEATFCPLLSISISWPLTWRGYNTHKVEVMVVRPRDKATVASASRGCEVMTARSQPRDLMGMRPSDKIIIGTSPRGGYDGHDSLAARRLKAIMIHLLVINEMIHFALCLVDYFYDFFFSTFLFSSPSNIFLLWIFFLSPLLE